MPAISFSFDLDSAAGLASFNEFIANRSYVLGFAPTQTDAAVVAAFGSAPDAATYPNAARYYNHIKAISASSGKWPAGVAVGGAVAAAPAAGAAAGKKAAAAPAPAPAAGGEESDDSGGLFDDDEEDEDAAAAAAAAAKARAAIAAAAANKGGKAPKIEKTQCVIEIMPKEVEVAMEDLEAAVRGINLEGLVWGVEAKIEEIGFGIKKLIMQAVIVNDLVDTQAITDAIELLPEASAGEIKSMNRL